MTTVHAMSMFTKNIWSTICLKCVFFRQTHSVSILSLFATHFHQCSLSTVNVNVKQIYEHNIFGSDPLYLDRVYAEGHCELMVTPKYSGMNLERLGWPEVL